VSRSPAPSSARATTRARVGERSRTGAHDARVGGRSARVVESVLGAALTELAEKGYVAMRVDDVAERAGVNKTTIYRRWPKKSDLVGAALRSLSEDDDGLPDTGSLRADLLVLLRRRVRVAANPQKRAAARVLTAELDHPEVAEIAGTVRAAFRLPWVRVVERAIERRELPHGTDAQLVVEIISSAVSTRLFRWQEKLSDGYLRAVVELVVRGASNGGAIRGAKPSQPRGAGGAKSK
jgi:AcrR family transcriptional regulator